ncbi:hypothetical protein M101_2579 [Bacteroides fragilis str. 1007-1-F |nr:hypothetical protein M101_2579 [Bacteroides fragilis str. 1007-1-F \
MPAAVTSIDAAIHSLLIDVFIPVCFAQYLQICNTNIQL